ncbi:MAG: hypothetical protein AABX40_02405, partial [Candidatus Hydrothermarchaeota archaeon]
LHPLIPSSGGMALGQDVYFLGYPYGLSTDVGPELNADFPLPLVKKAIVSSVVFRDNRLEYLLLDGHNNPGFSGGPVYYTPPGKPQEHRVAGVISGYRYEWEPVYLKQKESSLTYKYNTGIIIAVGIRIVLDIIDTNPTGYELKGE